MAETRTRKTTRTRRSNTRSTGSRLGAVGDSIRERPFATAAVATAAAAAGAFFARRSGVTSDTVAKWGQDAKEELGNLTERGKALAEDALQGAKSVASKATRKSAPAGDTGFDDTDQDQAAVGSVAYGA
ncbi:MULTISPECIES: hypothetical protein [Sphingomonas]|uniref:hypothetical protein n=1 Tax=Sphingomonas TaxID=13687 RepID=UPI000DEF71F9|nr:MULTISPECIES: hypothetical protein [Sphingomonas]